MKDTIAVILGGGKGTRLYPLTHQRSKPAVPLAGKFRLIDVPISNCINSDLKRIFVLTQYNSESLNRHINRTYQFDHFSKGFVSLLAAEQTPDNVAWFQGTADAIRQMKRHITSMPHELILVLSGDQLYRLDYNRLVEFHRKNDAGLTISVIPVSAAAATSLGVIQVDENNRFISITEKPNAEALDWLQSPNLPPETPFYGSMGIYLFNKDYLWEVMDRYPGDDLVTDVVIPAIRERRIFAYHFDDFWADIGTIKSFYDVNLSLTNQLPKFSLYDTHYPIYTHFRRLPGAKIHNSSIDRAIISEGSIIEQSNITRSIVGIRSMIRRNTTIENAIIMGADYYEMDYPEKFASVKYHVGVGENSVVRNCIIDKNVRIGNNVQIINQARKEFEDGENYFIRDGIVIVPKDCVIYDGTVI
jgi:glucose-1-phosphate adenylyltransferase